MKISPFKVADTLLPAANINPTTKKGTTFLADFLKENLVSATLNGEIFILPP